MGGASLSMTKSFSFEHSPGKNLTVAALLIADELTFKRGNAILLNKVSLKLQAGESLAIIGASGSGKSTLLKLLVGMLSPWSGSIAIAGKIQSPRQLEARVGLVAQDDILYTDLSSEQTLENLASLLREELSERERIAEVDRILRLLELRTCARRPVKTLSGGQRKRVSIAMELLQKPNVFLLDEPLSNLDPALRRRFFKLFERLCNEGLSLIVTTHQLENLLSFDKVLVLDKGHVTYFGGPQQLQEMIEEAGPGKDVFDVFSYSKSTVSQVAPLPQSPSKPTEKSVSRNSIRRFIRQYPILCLRRSRRLLKEHKRLVALLIQGPAIAFFLSLALSSPVQLLFMAILTSIWMGVSASALEIVGEKDILRRERRLGVSVSASLFSRMTALFLFTLIQCFLLLWVLRFAHSLPLNDGVFFLLLQLSAWTGLTLGFSISANMSRSATAGLVIPLVMIPQVLFGGIFNQESSSLYQVIERSVPARYAFDLTARCALADEAPTLVERKQYDVSIQNWEKRQREWSWKFNRRLKSQENMDLNPHLKGSQDSIDRLKKRGRVIEKKWSLERERWEEIRSEIARQDAQSEDFYMRAERLRTILPREEDDQSNVELKPEEESEGGLPKAENQERAWIDQTVDDAKTLLDGVDDLRSRQREWTMKLENLRRSHEEEGERFRTDWSHELKGLELQRSTLQKDLHDFKDRLEDSRSKFVELFRAQERHFERRKDLERLLVDGRLITTMGHGSRLGNVLALLGFNLFFTLIALLGMRRRI